MAGRRLRQFVPGRIRRLWRQLAKGRAAPHEQLRWAAKQMSDAIVATGYQHELVARKDGTIYVNADGVLLSTEATNRYFKVGAGRPANQGTAMASFLEAHSISPSTVVDVGANFGEISLYLARAYPKARILAVEPSDENLAVFRKNIAAQSPPIQNVELIKAAVSDVDGTTTISVGLSSENHILRQAAEAGHPTPCTTMPTLFLDHRIESVDFLKIDIEGSEPLLTDDLADLAPKVRTLLVEFSSKSSPESYERLLATLGHHYSIYSMSGSRLDLAEAQAALRAARARGGSVDFWFVRH